MYNYKDDLNISKRNYHDIVKMCRFFYKFDSISGCYDSETEVLTRNGWKFFKEVTSDDEIMTLDKETGTIEYQKPTGFVNKAYKGKMVTFYNKKSGINLVVTPNHNMFVSFRTHDKNYNKPIEDWSYELASAESTIGKQIKIKRDAIWLGKEEEFFDYKTIHVKMDDWLKFFGFWVAEGCVSKVEGQHSINLTNSNHDTLNEIKGILESWYINIHNLKNKNYIQFSNRHIHEYLREITGAHNKFIPELYKNLSTRQIRILLDYYRKGDGNHSEKSKNNGMVCWTSSVKLRDDLMELAIKSRYNGAVYRLSHKAGVPSYFKSQNRFITANYDGYTLSFLKRTSGSRLSPKDVSVIDYDGTIHCVEVPNHIMYVRRNGKPCWCGNTILNKMVDCCISAINVKRNKCTDKEISVYGALNPTLKEFFRNACLEYLLSGLVIPHYEWVRVKGSDLSHNLDSRTRYILPSNFWFRDPASISVKFTPIPNNRLYLVKVSPEILRIIKEPVSSLSPEDIEARSLLEKNYPSFVKRIRDSKGITISIPLEDIRPILARTLPEDPYPIPYMTNALEALSHKRNLRKMDYSIASRVTAAIQMIKLGDKDFPVTDNSDFDSIKSQMNFWTPDGISERVYQLFANHTLTIEWIYPNTEAMLNQEKYKSVDEDIIAGFGFPRTLITGETSKSNVTGGSDLATFSPIATMDAIRDKFVQWAVDLFKEIQEKNDFKGVAEPTFEPMKLYKLLDLNTIGEKLYLEGSLSRTTRLEMQGLDLQSELERKAEEKEMYVKYGVDESPVVPYSSPNLQNKETTPKAKEEVK
jgi:hypothetical protein